MVMRTPILLFLLWSFSVCCSGRRQILSRCRIPHLVGFDWSTGLLQPTACLNGLKTPTWQKFSMPRTALPVSCCELSGCKCDRNGVLRSVCLFAGTFYLLNGTWQAILLPIRAGSSPCNSFRCCHSSNIPVGPCRE